MYQNQYVYLINIHGFSYYKIGKTRNLESRIVEIQCANPFEVRLFSQYCVDDMAFVESVLHCQFQEQHIRGEWFDLSHDDLNKIDNLVKPYLAKEKLLPQQTWQLRWVETEGFFSDKKYRYQAWVMVSE